MQTLVCDSDKDLPRQALEALALDGYRENRLTQKQVGELLNLSRIQTEDFLAADLDLYDYDPAELSREAEQLREYMSDIFRTMWLSSRTAFPCGISSIPNAAHMELAHESAPLEVRTRIANPPSWLCVTPLIGTVDASLTEVLDPGESEAIELALELQADFILIDEKKGRSEADRRGLKVIGALGLIMEAYKGGLTDDPRDVLSELRGHGFRLSRRLILEFERLVRASQP